MIYCLGTLERFAKMTPDEVQRVGFEIAAPNLIRGESYTMLTRRRGVRGDGM